MHSTVFYSTRNVTVYSMVSEKQSIRLLFYAIFCSLVWKNSRSRFTSQPKSIQSRSSFIRIWKCSKGRELGLSALEFAFVSQKPASTSLLCNEKRCTSSFCFLATHKLAEYGRSRCSICLSLKQLWRSLWLSCLIFPRYFACREILDTSASSKCAAVPPCSAWYTKFCSRDICSPVRVSAELALSAASHPNWFRTECLSE